MSEVDHVLRAVIARPGCSAWSLGVLSNPPKGMGDVEWKELIRTELPRLHAEGKVQATQYGVNYIAWWPARTDLHPWAGELVSVPAPIEVPPIDGEVGSRPA